MDWKSRHLYAALALDWMLNNLFIGLLPVETLGGKEK